MPESQEEEIPRPMPLVKKLGGFDFWRQTLKSARFVVAPMVDQSELAWRMLSRQLGAELCYTPMLHSKVFAEDRRYREKEFTTCAEDRPLIVQFCGDDPDLLLKSALMVQDRCDAVDLNLGCPQNIAKRGHYGSYLQDEWELIHRLVSCLHQGLNVPVTVKIRVFPEVEKTVRYAKMIEAAGAQLLTVHGRTREQKGQLTGLADWEQIKAVREAVNIPVFANGNILWHEDVQKCLDATGAQGVMSAEGNLYNPAIFAGPKLPLIKDMVTQYLDLVQKYPTQLSFVRGHLFKMFRPALHLHADHRTRIGSAHSLEELSTASLELCELLEQDRVNGLESSDDPPHWVCQPYFRPPPPPNHGVKTTKRVAEQCDEDSKCAKLE